MDWTDWHIMPGFWDWVDAMLFHGLYGMPPPPPSSLAFRVSGAFYGVFMKAARYDEDIIITHYYDDALLVMMRRRRLIDIGSNWSGDTCENCYLQMGSQLVARSRYSDTISQRGDLRSGHIVRFQIHIHDTGGLSYHRINKSFKTWTGW